MRHTSRSGVLYACSFAPCSRPLFGRNVQRRGLMGQGFRRLVVLSFALLALAPAAARADSLELLGKSNLGGGGLNGQVATVGNIAVVGSGILGGAGARTSYYASYPCPPTTVKIVDVSD